MTLERIKASVRELSTLLDDLSSIDEKRFIGEIGETRILKDLAVIKGILDASAGDEREKNAR